MKLLTEVNKSDRMMIEEITSFSKSWLMGCVSQCMYKSTNDKIQDLISISSKFCNTSKNKQI